MGKLKKKDAAKLFREWVVNQEDFEVDPETGLPALPKGLHWYLREDFHGYFDLDIRHGEGKVLVRHPLRVGHHRPWRGELPGHAIELLEREAEEYLLAEAGRREEAPLGAYPPNSVLK